MPPIQIVWLDKTQQIMRVDYPKDWTWDDYHRNIDRIANLLNGNDRPIYFINVYAPGVQLPRTAPSPHYRRTVRTLTIGYVTYVTTDHILVRSLKTFLHSINYRENEQYSFVKSVPDALQLLTSKIAGEQAHH